jgi:DinB superfamily
MERIKWTERKFLFDITVDELPSVIERLNSTISKLKEFSNTLSIGQLTHKSNGKWSIQENIGHLCDLEDLHEGRIDDFLARKEILRAADMANIKTNEGNHNKANINDIVTNFVTKRKRFISRLEELDPEIQNFQSLHPRLQILMRPIDMACFTTEHDSHHLETIQEILKNNPS